MSPDPILRQYWSGKPNGGVFSPQNLSVYSYALNNPVKLVDQTGDFAQVSVNGNHVFVTVPALFRNASSMSDTQFREKVQAWKASVEKTYSGKFGRYQVHTFVEVLSERDARGAAAEGGGLNVITVMSRKEGENPGSATRWSLLEENARQPRQQKGDSDLPRYVEGEYKTMNEGRASIATDAQDSTVSHEFGHLLGLPDNDDTHISRRAEPQNIMTQLVKGRQPGARPSEAQIRDVTRRCNQNCR